MSMTGWALLIVLAAEPTRQIGDRVELFVDDWLIAEKKGVELRLNPPERREIVLATDKPWEGPDSAYFSVFKDGSKYRLYYRGFCPSDLSDEQVTCTAESDDGVHFVRPELGLIDFRGSKQNNIVYHGDAAHNFAPFVDSRPGVTADERYKALAGVSGRKLYAFASADGYRWRKLQEAPVQSDGHFDSLNIAFWDSRTGEYRCFSRFFDNANIRRIQSSTSPDFLHWTKPTPHQYSADSPNEHFYTNATVPCPGAPHIYLSFPKRFVPERTKMEGYKDVGVSDAVMMTSRDGVHFDRPFLEAWLRPGRDPKNWTQRSNMTAWGVVETPGDEFSLYVSEHYGWPSHRIRRVAVPRYRFASIYAGRRGGELKTHPLQFEGDDLVLNYATSAAGSVRIEIQNDAGLAIPGYTLVESETLFGDELERPFHWKVQKNVASLKGKPIRLRFVLEDADVYAIQFTKKR